MRKNGSYLKSCQCNKMSQYLPPTLIKLNESNISFQAMIACLLHLALMLHVNFLSANLYSHGKNETKLCGDI